MTDRSRRRQGFGMPDPSSPSSSKAARPQVWLITWGWRCYWLVLTFLLLSPKLPPSPVPIDRRAWLAHFGTFWLLAWGVCHVRWMHGGTLSRRWRVAWAGVFVAYGGVAELLQPWVHRDADWGDWLADGFGILIGMLLAPPVLRFFALRSKHANMNGAVEGNVTRRLQAGDPPED